MVICICLFKILAVSPVRKRKGFSEPPPPTYRRRNMVTQKIFYVNMGVCEEEGAEARGQP